MSNTTINNGQTVTETVTLDELREALTVRSGGSVQTSELTGVVTQNIRNRIRVDQNGLIQSNQTAIQVEGVDSIINNFGTISGDLNGVNIDNDITASARVHNSGTITSGAGGRAVNIGSLGGILSNSGLITGTGDPRNGTIYGDVTAQSVAINNQADGVIDVGAGLNGDAISLELGAQVNGSIINRGLVQGRGLPDGPANNATNQAAALRFYWVPAAGEPISNFNGNVSNFGTLAAENGAAVIVENQTQLNGNIINQGLIESANPADGIGISFENGSQLNGAIINSGTINGGRDGINFANGGQVGGMLRNLAGGVITSTSRAVNIGGNGNQVINGGQMLTTADPRNGTLYADVTANNFTIHNLRSGVIDVGAGNNGDAVSLELGADVTGSVVNQGLIQGRGLPDGLPNNVTNQATAVRLYHGSDVGDLSVFRGDVSNLRQGILASEQDDAILIESQVQLEGNILNQGTLTAGSEGIDIDGTVMGKIQNQGTITADHDGVQLSGALAGDINNFGEILATHNGVTLAGTLAGTLNNAGLIRGNIAIDASSAQAGVTVHNSGAVLGNVVLSNFDDHFDATSGTVSGSIEGLDGDDLLIGSRFSDVLVGGLGDDTLTGGLSADTFMLKPNELGADTITDFQTGLDSLDVSAFNFGVADLQAVINNAQQLESDALLTFTPNTTVLLQGIQASNLDTSDFALA
jgi:hypothetical protein